MEASDFSFVLSGGTINIDPNQSLGGEASNFPLQDNTVNNLYDDLTAEDTDAGNIDYRCFYLFNDGSTSCYNIRFWIYEDFAVSSDIKIGATLRDETQRVVIAGEPTYGYFVLGFEGATIQIDFDDDFAVMLEQFNTEIKAMSSGGDLLFREVNVTGQQFNDNTWIFDIAFSGLDGRRTFSLFEVIQNALGPRPTIEVSYLTQGSPINTVASPIGLETTTPGGIDFYTPSESSPIILPRLSEGDGLPIWIERTTEAGAVARQLDGFSIRLQADELPL